MIGSTSILVVEDKMDQSSLAKIWKKIGMMEERKKEPEEEIAEEVIYVH